MACVCFKCLCFVSAWEQQFIAETCSSLFVHRRWRILYKRTYLLNYSMPQSPSWEDNRFSASQEIPRILKNPKVHYRIHKGPPPVHTLRQIDSVHTDTFQIIKIHFNIIIPSMPESPKWYLSLRFPQQNPAYASPLSDMCYMSRPNHSSIGVTWRNLCHVWWTFQREIPKAKFLHTKCVGNPVHTPRHLMVTFTITRHVHSKIRTQFTALPLCVQTILTIHL